MEPQPSPSSTPQPRQSTPAEGAAITSVPAGEVELCPMCSEPRDPEARYCEACRYDFENPPPPPEPEPTRLQGPILWLIMVFWAALLVGGMIYIYTVLWAA